MPNEAVMGKAITIGSAFGAGLVEAAAYRANKTAGTIVTFGGAIGGRVGAMWLKGRLADVAEGIASSSAGSMGHFAITAVWPAKRAALGSGRNGKTPIGSSNPRELVGGESNAPRNRVAQEIMNDELYV